MKVIEDVEIGCLGLLEVMLLMKVKSQELRIMLFVTLWARRTSLPHMCACSRSLFHGPLIFMGPNC